MRDERPPCSTAPRILIDSTGSTQGMKLRMKPPSSASGRMPRSGLEPAAGGAALAVTAASSARSPSTSVTVSGLPTTRSVAARPPKIGRRSSDAPALSRRLQARRAEGNALGGPRQTHRGAAAAGRPATWSSNIGCLPGITVAAASARAPSPLARHARGVAGDERGKAAIAGARRPRRQSEGQHRVIGDADLLAGEIATARDADAPPVPTAPASPRSATPPRRS